MFPTSGVRLMHLLVVSDYRRSLTFYTEVLGATVTQEMPGSLAFLEFAGGQLLLSVAGGPTLDKPTVTFAPPKDPQTVHSEITIRVPDCQAAYQTLLERGAVFLTPPVVYPWEIRAFFRDPDGHLIEISQGGEYAPDAEQVKARPVTEMFSGQYGAVKVGRMDVLTAAVGQATGSVMVGDA